jgi:hypothetical protein
MAAPRLPVHNDGGSHRRRVSFGVVDAALGMAARRLQRCHRLHDYVAWRIGSAVSGAATPSANNLKQIALALHFYENEHGSLPPAYLTDAEGRPMHSWRVLLLPYLEEHALYKQYNFAEPWDSPHNLKVAAKMPDVFRYPADPRGTQFTPYVVVVDDESLFPGEQGVKLEEIDDGTSRTLAMLEWPESNIVWTEPRDLDLPSLHHITHPPRAAIKGRRRHPGGRTLISLAEGSIRILPLHETSVSRLRELITRAGGERHELLNE